MKLRTFSGFFIVLILMTTVSSALSLQLVKADPEFIYIKADGTIDPPSAPITVNGLTYTLTSDVYSAIVIQKDGITVDGASHFIQGQGASIDPNTGVELIGRLNVVIKNLVIEQFRQGIYLGSSSSGCIITSNTILNNNLRGILFDSSSNNYIVNNDIENTLWDAIWLRQSSNYNTVNGNTLKNNGDDGIGLSLSADGNLIYENNIIGNYYGVELGINPASGNIIYHNNFIGNTIQVYDPTPAANTWDNGYPSGGNYWSDYAGVDMKQGPTQSLKGSDLIGDTPYVIDQLNIDHYPLMTTWSPLPSSISGLISEVNQLSSKGQFASKLVTNVLLVNLNVAQKFFDRGKLNDALITLRVFRAIVQNLPSSQITPTARNLLLGSTDNVLSDLK